MEFIADKQTLNDLNILGKYKNNSMFYIFNQVKTQGGEKLLNDYFLHPLTDADAINKRSQAFAWFQQSSLEFPFNAAEFETMENYLVSGGTDTWFNSFLQFTRRRTWMAMGLPAEFDEVSNGVSVTVKVLSAFSRFLYMLQKDPANPFYDEIAEISNQLTEGPLATIFKNGDDRSIVALFKTDHLLRNALYQNMNELLAFIYKLDVFVAVGAVGRRHGFTYAIALPAASYLLEIEDFRHPAISKAVGNTLSLNQNSNVLFLTGANMAGKSTLMKSFGIALYLAHMGFPVSAKYMRFSVKGGIISSINVPDDLNKGFSHFYAEVLRVKQVAQLVKDKHDIVVIFDELFKGTNVKDAYDATLSVTEAFSTFRNCNYIISTHIIEVGEALQQRCDNVQFRYMPTVMEGNTPRYPYVMKQGITADRHGMTIIENEKIMEIMLG